VAKSQNNSNGMILADGKEWVRCIKINNKTNQMGNSNHNNKESHGLMIGNDFRIIIF
jgi:hypothetical protein